MVHNLIQMNFNAVVLCILFAGYVMIDRCFDNKIRTYFLCAAGLTLVLIAIDDILWLEKQRTYPTSLRAISDAAGYMLRPFIAIIVTGIFSESNKRVTSRKRMLLFLTPLFVNAVAVFISLWNGVVFSYDAQNQFVRGPLGYITFVVGFFYMGYMVVLTIKYFKLRKKGEVLVILMMATLCVVGTMFESWFHFVGFLTGVSSIGMVLYYLYLHVSIYSLDALTGAYNRRIFYLDIKKVTEQVILVSMDLNDLKKVNDTKGHQQGDVFLITYAEEVMRNKSKRTQFYRVGGDEFLLLVKGSTEEQVYSRIETIQENLNKKGYSFAYGISTFKPSDNVDQMIECIDQKMYEKKMKMKKDM